MKCCQPTGKVREFDLVCRVVTLLISLAQHMSDTRLLLWYLRKSVWYPVASILLGLPLIFGTGGPTVVGPTQ